MPVTGYIVGAIHDPDVSQGVGGLSTGIGVSHRGRTLQHLTGFRDGTSAALRRIGAPSNFLRSTTPNFRDKEMQYWRATAPTVDGAGVGGGAPDFKNRTSETLLTGESCWAVNSAVSLSNYLYLPGLQQHYAYRNNAASNQMNGDFEAIAKVALAAYPPVAICRIMTKDNAQAANATFRMSVTLTGTLQMAISNGVAYVNNESSLPLPAHNPALGYQWVKVSVRPDFGGNRRIRFFTSQDYNPVDRTGVWTELGVEQVAAAWPLNPAGTSPLTVGALGNGTAPLAGKIWFAEFRNGIDGPTFSTFDANNFVLGAMQAYAGEPWNIRVGTLANPVPPGGDRAEIRVGY